MGKIQKLGKFRLTPGEGRDAVQNRIFLTIF